MEAALGWIGAIVEWLGQFFPRWRIIPSTTGYVKFIKGTRIESGVGGVVWFWPATTVLMEHPVVRQAIDLRGQTMSTSDEKSILVGGLLTYVISDIEKALVHTWNVDETSRDSALTAVHSVISGMTWAEVKTAEKSGTLERLLRIEARKTLEPYGIRVLKLTLTDLAPTRVVKISMTSDTV